MSHITDNKQQPAQTSIKNESINPAVEKLELFAEELPTQQDLLGIATASTFSTGWGSTAGTLASFSSK